jgi:hypothetical protein
LKQNKWIVISNKPISDLFKMDWVVRFLSKDLFYFPIMDLYPQTIRIPFWNFFYNRLESYPCFSRCKYLILGYESSDITLEINILLLYIEQETIWGIFKLSWRQISLVCHPQEQIISKVNFFLRKKILFWSFLKRKNLRAWLRESFYHVFLWH